MNFNMNWLGFEGVIVTKVEKVEGTIHFHVECERKPHPCPNCGELTDKVHDYRIQKVKHLKLFERFTFLFYRRRRYACSCGKKFSENNPFVAKYQRHTIEWNQAIGIRAIKGKTFKDVAETYGTSPTTVIRRFDKIAATHLTEVDELPEVIAIDEYKGDTDGGKYQLIIADGVTKKPLDILPNRFSKTIEKYLREKGSNVKIVIMDMSHSFRSAVRRALGSPTIVADRFHFCRYVYWALERVRRRVQKDFHEYDRKKCKRFKHIFYKPHHKLGQKEKWLLERYFKLSRELKMAYKIKEAYVDWFTKAKEGTYSTHKALKEGLYRFYRLIKEKGIPEFFPVIKTFQNWQKEILNTFISGYNNGFLEGINNTTKVLKRNAYGFRRYDRFRKKILLSHQIKDIGAFIG